MAPHEPVAAEVRAEMARQQISGIKAAKELGWTQRYIAVRLRGEVPFSINDLAAMATLLGVAVTSFFQAGPMDPGAMIRLLAPPEVRKPGSCPPALGVAA